MPRSFPPKNYQARQATELEEIIQTMQARVDEMYVIEQESKDRLDRLEGVHRSWQHERRELNKKIDDWHKMLYRFEGERDDVRKNTESMLEKASERIFWLNVLGGLYLLVFFVADLWHRFYAWAWG